MNAGMLPVYARQRAEPACGAGMALRLRGVDLGYAGVPVVAGLTGEFAQGSLTAVVGPNGGGKTTLLKGLAGLVAPCSGTIETLHARRDLAYLSQASEVDAGFPVTVGDFVSMGLWAELGALRAVTHEQTQRVAAALRAVGLAGHEARWVDELSGGQFQRMRFARLLVQDSALLLLDEPFAGVDEPTQRALLGLVAGWHAQGKTVVVVLHNLDLVRQHFTQALALAGRALAWGATAAALGALAVAGGAR